MQAGWKESLPSSPLPPPLATELNLPPPQTDKDGPAPKKVKARPPPLKKTFDSVDKWVKTFVYLLCKAVEIMDGQCVYTVYFVCVCMLVWQGAVWGVFWGALCRAARVSAWGGFAFTHLAESGHFTPRHSGQLSAQEEELYRFHSHLMHFMILLTKCF